MQVSRVALAAFLKKDEQQGGEEKGPKSVRALESHGASRDRQPNDCEGQGRVSSPAELLLRTL